MRSSRRSLRCSSLVQNVCSCALIQKFVQCSHALVQNFRQLHCHAKVYGKVLFFKVFGGHMCPILELRDPVLDFWWRLLCVSTPEWVLTCLLVLQIFWDPPLVIHLSTSWQAASQLLTFPHASAEVWVGSDSNGQSPAHMTNELSCKLLRSHALMQKFVRKFLLWCCQTLTPTNYPSLCSEGEGYWDGSVDSPHSWGR